MRKKARKNEVSFAELLSGSGIEIYEEEVVRKHWFRRFLRIFGAFLMFLVVSVITGAIISTLSVVAVSGAMVAAEPAVEAWKAIPSDLEDIAIAQRNTLYDINGNVFAEVWSEDRVEVQSLDEVGEYAQQALIDTEDKRFYDHEGFDFKGTVRSALTGSGGGSGITQQLVKNLQFYNLLDENADDATEQTYARKIRELKISMQYEKEHSKDEILLAYFNTVAFGGPSVYGIETASRYLFGKSSKDLTIAEASALVGTVKNPSSYNMANKDNETKWKDRQTVVLGRMLAEKHITQEEYDAARIETLNIVPKRTSGGNCYSSSYPMYCRYTLDALKNDESLGETAEERETLLARGGLHIKTYLDPSATDAVEKKLKDGYGIKNDIVAPTAIVQPGTGGVMAIAQNRDWGSNEDDGETTIITPDVPTGEGSVYKIFTLAAALNSGLDENDLTFGSACPLIPGKNYDSPPNGFKNSSSCELQGGVLNYKQATAYSSNTWYVTLEMRIGVNAVKDFSRSVGLAAPDSMTPRSLSYTLGVVGNTPIDVAAATATFANKGIFCPATPIVGVAYADGKTPAVPDSYNPADKACRSVMSPHSAGVVLKAMRANLSGEVPRAFGLEANIPGYDTVGKSGTNGNLNTTWVQLSQQYSIYTNLYDMDRPVRGIGSVRFRGVTRPWHDNTAKTVVSEILTGLLKGKKNVPLDYDNPQRDFAPTPINESSFFTIPSVVGMSPENAVQVLQGLGVVVNVSKIVKPLPDNYPSGVIVEQSILAGEKLSKGTEKEIVLFIGK